MPRKFLYIAKERGVPPNEFKPGRTTQPLAKRMSQLGGQTNSKFDLVQGFETLCDVTAEALAFDEIDRRGFRKNPGTQKETTVCDLPVLVDILTRAIALADRIHMASPRAERRIVMPASVSSIKLQASTKLVGQILASPVPHAGKTRELSELLERAVDDCSFRKQLTRFGIRFLARRENKSDFELDWNRATDVVNWLNTKKVKLPLSASTKFQLQHV